MSLFSPKLRNMYINNLHVQKGYGWQTRYPQPNILNIQLAGITWSSSLIRPTEMISQPITAGWTLVECHGSGPNLGVSIHGCFHHRQYCRKSTIYIYIYRKKTTFALRLHVWMLWYLGGYGSTGTTTKENVINLISKYNRQQSWGCPKIWEYPKKPSDWLCPSCWSNQ